MSARIGIRRLVLRRNFRLLLGVSGGFLAGACLGLSVLGLAHRILLTSHLQLPPPMLLGALGVGGAALSGHRAWTRLQVPIAWAVAGGGAAVVLIPVLAGSLALSHSSHPAVVWGSFLGALCLVGMRWYRRSMHGSGSVGKRLLVLGATGMADRLLRELSAHDPGYTVLGCVDDRSFEQIGSSNGIRLLGKTSQLQEIVKENRAETLVVALEDRRGNLPLEAILGCKLRGVRVEDWPTFYEKLSGKIFVRNLRPSWLIFSDGFKRTQCTRIIKRCVDLGVSVVFLVLGMPVFLVVAALIKLDSPGPVFFHQERVGEGGRTFNLTKFRTMRADAEKLTGPVWATEKDPRITRLGRWLRKVRLDEFPQIINVLKGEMSFVGPRPERPCFVAQLQEMIPFYSYRHTVKPGITGWAQVRYPYGATIEDAEEKLQYDLYYIKHLGGILDTSILLATVRVVLFGKGAR
jgi:sugar transferase (PEP-CTERM system associated)